MKLVKFYATWCEPCKQLDKVVQSKKDQIPEDWTYSNIDIEQDMNSAKALNVRGVPTMIIMSDDNVEVRRHVGFLNERDFEQFLRGR